MWFYGRGSVGQQVNIQSPESAIMILVVISELLYVSNSDETVAELSVDSCMDGALARRVVERR